MDYFYVLFIVFFFFFFFFKVLMGFAFNGGTEISQVSLIISFEYERKSGSFRTTVHDLIFLFG